MFSIEMHNKKNTSKELESFNILSDQMDITTYK